MNDLLIELAESNGYRFQIIKIEVLHISGWAQTQSNKHIHFESISKMKHWNSVFNVFHTSKCSSDFMLNASHKTAWCLIVSFSEDQHSQRGRTALLLPPLHLCRRHRKHPPRLQWLSRHHTEDASAAVRALVMGGACICSAHLPAYLTPNAATS